MTSSSKNLRRVLMGTAAAALITLSACGGETPTDQQTSTPPSASGTPSAVASATPTPTPTVPAATDLSGITVSDTDVPEITFESPWRIEKTQVKVLRTGASPQKVEADATVTVNYVGVNGSTGETFDGSYESGTPATFDLGQGIITGFKLGLEGQSVGSRVLVGAAAEDGYPEGTQDGSIAAGDSLVFVIDIIAASFSDVQGEAVVPAAGLPTVTMTADKPEVQIPVGAQAPAELQIQPLVKGVGEPVAANSTVSVRFRSWNFADGVMFEDAWQAQAGSLDKLIAGWQKGLVGQTAGSRVLLVVPPAQAYPDGLPDATPPLAAGQTLVYVIDILDVSTPVG